MVDLLEAYQPQRDQTTAGSTTRAKLPFLPVVDPAGDQHGLVDPRSIQRGKPLCLATRSGRHIDDDEPYVEEPFDESILTPEQSVKVDELCKENPMLTREDMAVMLRLNLMSHRATLEGRELTCIEIRMTQQLKEEDTLEDHIDDDEPYVEEPFDESILTPEQSVKVDELCNENPMMTREDMAVMLRLNLMSHRATLEGRELTCIEIRMDQHLKEVFYWVPPTQLEGICNSTLELHFEDIFLPCVEEIAYDLNSHVLINECLDLICITKKLDDLRVEKLARDHIEVCFDKNYLCASIDLESDILMLDESRPLLELADLGDELDVDRLLLEIENPLVKNNHENENIVFYFIDGDRVDYFVKTSEAL
ncbi:hypothetical protein F2Q70_00027722 [Brassica cretica]|uniref:Uncharacterized protein n=1 Tax=Brassica cretica TaxID=69181 RepID=A0A8S9LCF8_BRACR|nr:hypothetical protein F2Q70_00027722 [Brassica cretica]